MNWYLKALKKYAVFSGRARRKEYWMFWLFNAIAVLAIAFIEVALDAMSIHTQGLLVSVYQLAIVIPGIAVGIRRMHDTDHSGWWNLCPIVNFIFAIREGQRHDNRFGPDPKAAATSVAT